jgi:hypothetical protein
MENTWCRKMRLPASPHALPRWRPRTRDSDAHRAPAWPETGVPRAAEPSLPIGPLLPSKQADCVTTYGEAIVLRENQAGTERGMQLAASLPDIMPEQADERIKPIYEEIQQTLRVPIVNLIFRTLANYPDYLEPAWREIRPLACSRVFEQSANELRAQALLPSSPEPTDLASMPGDIDRLRAFNDTIHYVLPKLLLIVTALAKTHMEHEVEQPATSLTLDLSTIPSGVAEGAEKVAMVDPGKVDQRVQAIFDSIKERHSHPLVSSYYRGLANWPDFLETAWNIVAPRIGSEEYEARKHALLDSARSHVRAWPAISPQLEPKVLTQINDILAAFRVNFIPAMLLDVALVKSLLDGSGAARASRFSAV